MNKKSRVCAPTLVYIIRGGQNFSKAISQYSTLIIKALVSYAERLLNVDIISFCKQDIAEINWQNWKKCIIAADEEPY